MRKDKEQAIVPVSKQASSQREPYSFLSRPVRSIIEAFEITVKDAQHTIKEIFPRQLTKISVNIVGLLNHLNAIKTSVADEYAFYQQKIQAQLNVQSTNFSEWIWAEKKLTVLQNEWLEEVQVCEQQLSDYSPVSGDFKALVIKKGGQLIWPGFNKARNKGSEEEWMSDKMELIAFLNNAHHFLASIKTEHEFKQIKQNWQDAFNTHRCQLLLKYHPDRNGTTADFSEVNKCISLYQELLADLQPGCSNRAIIRAASQVEEERLKTQVSMLEKTNQVLDARLVELKEKSEAESAELKEKNSQYIEQLAQLKAVNQHNEELGRKQQNQINALEKKVQELLASISANIKTPAVNQYGFFEQASDLSQEKSTINSLTQMPD